MTAIKNIYYCLFLVIPYKNVFCQVVTKPTLVVEVVKIDTLSIIDHKYATTSGPFDKEMAQVVYFKLIKKSTKTKSTAKNMIVTQISPSDHICPYDFKVGLRYTMPAIQIKFSSSMVRSELIGWQYTTYCQDMPKAIKLVANAQGDASKAKGMYIFTAYFSGNGAKYVTTSQYFGYDLDLLMKQVDSASNGRTVAIDYLQFMAPDGKTTMIKDIPYNFNRLKDTTLNTSKVLIQIDELKSYKFISGTIYFAGFGYHNVTSAKASDIPTLYQYYARCGPGTTITLDNCIYKNANGTLSSPLNRSIKLEE